METRCMQKEEGWGAREGKEKRGVKVREEERRVGKVRREGRIHWERVDVGPREEERRKNRMEAEGQGRRKGGRN